MNPDLILSTLPLAHNLPVMTVLISLFLNYEDESKIFQALGVLDKNHFREEHAEEIQQLIDERFFYSDLDLGTRDEVIDFMCDNLLEAGCAPEGFKSSVHKREDISSTSFVYSFAIPHSMNVNCYESNLSVAILKNPIPWGDYDVHLVILLGFAKDQQSIMRIFLDWMSNVLSDSNEFTKLIQSKTRDEFVQQFI